MRVASVIIVAATVPTFAAICTAAVTRLAASDRAALERPQNIELLYSTRAIPAAVKSACAAVISDHRFWLAEPGKSYNETDVESDDKIPSRRLLSTQPATST